MYFFPLDVDLYLDISQLYHVLLGVVVGLVCLVVFQLYHGLHDVDFVYDAHQDVHREMIDVEMHPCSHFQTFHVHIFLENQNNEL